MADCLREMADVPRVAAAAHRPALPGQDHNLRALPPPTPTTTVPTTKASTTSTPATTAPPCPRTVRFRSRLSIKSFQFRSGQLVHPDPAGGPEAQGGVSPWLLVAVVAAAATVVVLVWRRR